jgi:hypothetical protein
MNYDKHIEKDSRMVGCVVLCEAYHIGYFQRCFSFETSERKE